MIIYQTPSCRDLAGMIASNEFKPKGSRMDAVFNLLDTLILEEFEGVQEIDPG